MGELRYLKRRLQALPFSLLPFFARLLFHSSALTESLAQATLSWEIIKLVKLFSQPIWPNYHEVANQE